MQLGRTTVKDKPAPAPKIDAGSGEYARITAEIDAITARIDAMNARLAPVAEVMVHIAQRDVLLQQQKVARGQEWQRLVNDLTIRKAAAMTELETTGKRLAELTESDERARREFFNECAWDSHPHYPEPVGEAFVARRIELFGMIERAKLEMRQIAARRAECIAEVKDCSERLDGYHRLGLQALYATEADLVPGRIAAGPDTPAARIAQQAYEDRVRAGGHDSAAHQGHKGTGVGAADWNNSDD